MILSQTEQILRSYMDYSDKDTLKLMTEGVDSQDKILVALTSKLYEKILEKYDKIDFSSISRSRGDITKIEKYDSLVECIDIINKLVIEYKEDTYPVDVVNSAMENIRSRTAMFKKAFAINAPIAVMTYNTMVMSIVESISFLISTCVEYVKVPQAETFQMALDTVAYNNTRQNLMFESLDSFNQGCKTGEFDDAMKVCLTTTRVNHEASEVEVKYDSPFVDPSNIESDETDVVIHDDKESVREGAGEVWDKGLGIGNLVGKAFYFLIKLLIPAIRTVVYFHYARRQKKSDTYLAQATLIEMNAMQLQYNTSIDPEKRKKIFDKQMKIAEKYRNKANKYNVDYTVAKKTSERMIEDENKQFRATDLGITSTVAFDPKSSSIF